MIDRRETFPEHLIQPHWYYSGNRFDESDLEFINRMLGTLNKENRLVACQYYEDMYIKTLRSDSARDARKLANEWLRDIAQHCGISGREYAAAKQANQIDHKFIKEIERIKALKPKVTILGIADNGNNKATKVRRKKEK